MDHDQRVCPSCGGSAGEYHFCPSCLAPIDSLTGIPARVGTLDATAEATAEPSGARVDGSEISIRPDGLSGASQLPQDVARLDQVLTVGDQLADKNARRGDGRTISIRTDGLTGAPQAPRDVARLEDVLTVGPPAEATPERERVESVAPPTERTPERVESVPPPTSTPEPAAEPRYVPAHQLRAAFWFEQTSAFESHDDDVAARLVHLLSAPEVEAELESADGVSLTEPLESEADSAVGQTSRNHWLAALCLLALLGVVLVLTGRRPRRCTDEATS